MQHRLHGFLVLVSSKLKIVFFSANTGKIVQLVELWFPKPTVGGSSFSLSVDGIPVVLNIMGD